MVLSRKKNRRWQTFSPSGDPSHIVTDLWFDRSRSPATSTSTIVVNTAAQFDELYEEHLSSDKSTPIIGFDAEWVSAENYLYQNGRDPWLWPPPDKLHSEKLRKTIETGGVSLVQLSTCSGVTLLCRVGIWASLPSSFVSLMENRRVLKVGVQPESDAKQLYSSFRIRMRGTFDIRWAVVGHPQFKRSAENSNESSLKAIGSKLFGLSFPAQHMRLRQSNWNTVELDEQQIHYAAIDSQLAIDAFLFCAPVTLCLPRSPTVTNFSPEPPSCSGEEGLKDICLQVVRLCKRHVDQKFAPDAAAKETKKLNRWPNRTTTSGEPACKDDQSSSDSDLDPADSSVGPTTIHEALLEGRAELQSVHDSRKWWANEVNWDPSTAYPNWDVEEEYLVRTKGASPEDYQRIHQELFQTDVSRSIFALPLAPRPASVATSPIPAGVESQLISQSTLVGVGRASRRVPPQNFSVPPGHWSHDHIPPVAVLPLTLDLSGSATCEDLQEAIGGGETSPLSSLTGLSSEISTSPPIPSVQDDNATSVQPEQPGFYQSSSGEEFVQPVCLCDPFDLDLMDRFLVA